MSESSLKTGIIKVPEKTKREADRVGWLTKEGEKWKTWNKRWFVLKDNFLYYFSDQQSSEPKGVVLLDGCEVSRMEKEKKKFIFCLKSKKSFTDKTGFTDRSYLLQADTEKDMNEWMNALKSATPGKLLPHTQKRTEEIAKLFKAAEKGDVSQIKSLLSAGLDASIFDDEGNTPIHWATVCGHIAVVKLLLESGVNKNIKTRDGFTPLHATAQEDRVEILQLLLTDYGIDPEIPNTEDNMHTTLHYAACWGSTQVAKYLLHAKASLNPLSKDKSTPLCYAAEKGSFEIVRMLVEAGAKVNVKNDEVEKGAATPLLLACHHGRVEIAKYLLSKGANAQDVTTDGLNVLHLALRSNTENQDLLKTLLDNGAQINGKTKSGDTPLHYAAYLGQVNSVSILIQRGAELDLKGQQESTPLHFAAREGHYEIAKLLLDSGCNTSSVDKDGDTPLICADVNGHTKIAELLSKDKSKN